MPIPIQSACDDDDFSWALVAPGDGAVVPLWMHESDLRAIAKHLYQCGLRHHKEMQEVWYEPPREDAGLLEAGAGRWVEGPEPGVPPHGHGSAPAESGVTEVVESMSPELRQAMLAALLSAKTADEETP